MHQKTIITALALASGLSLVGCSGDSTAHPESPSDSPAASQTSTASPSSETMKLDQAFYAKTPYGTDITVDFSALAPADIESYRKAAGIDPGSYAKATLDNRQGSDDAGIYKVVFYDADGKSYEFDDVMNHVNEWQPVSDYDTEVTSYTLQNGTPITEAQYGTLNDQWITIQDEHLNGASASVHEKAEGYIASAETKLPEDITAIEVWYKGILEDPIYMTPVSEKDGYKVSEATEPKKSQSDEDAEKEYQEWVANGSDCSDAAIRALGKQTMVAVTFECSFNEGAEEAPAPTGTDAGVGIGAPTTASTEGTADLSDDVVEPESFTYDEAYAAWQGGMPYYDAFCINYVPTTDGGRSQCEGIQAGTVDRITGEYIGG